MAKHPLQPLIDELARLPGIGVKSATRLAFYIYRSPSDYVKRLTEQLKFVKEKIKLCSLCANLSEDDICPRCCDQRLVDETLCVVETPQDLLAIERSQRFRGRFHVLHGVLSPLEGIGPDQLKIKELLQRIDRGGVLEVIVATNPTVEGEATALYLAKLLCPKGVKVTRLSLGIPMGAELEYIDEVTLDRAIHHRIEVHP